MKITIRTAIAGFFLISGAAAAQKADLEKKLKEAVDNPLAGK